MDCEHKWFFQGSDCKEKQEGRMSYEVTRIDTYYCEKCLERKEVIAKKETRYRGAHTHIGLRGEKSMGLTLKEAKKKYREKNKECRFCEFSCVEQTVVENWGGNLADVSVERVIYCKLSEETAGNICEFYQVEELSEIVEV